MAVHFELIGADELRRALRALPAELAGEARGIVDRAAEAARAAVVAGYPARTGNLRNNVRLTTAGSGAGVSATLRSSAKHAHLYEFGTAIRHTRRGWLRGAMHGAPLTPKPVFVPAVMRHRAAMTADLIALVERAGFQVTGT
jgi:hypothetical protein